MFQPGKVSSDRDAILVCALPAVATYLWLKWYEAKSLSTLTVLLGVVPAFSTVLLSQSLSFLRAASLSFVVHYAVVLSCACLYRLSPFHPLAPYPGPFLCKISKLWLVYMTSRGKLHLYFHELHSRYGPIVRVGPNELSTTEVDIFPFILGPQGMPKGSLWEGRRISGKRGAGAKNAKGHLIGARDKKLHAESRRVWNRAFTTAAVKGYEPILIRRTAQLSEELNERCAEKPQREVEADLSQWLSYFTFDFMGDMVFGGGFELMHDGDKDGIYKTMVAGLQLPALTQQIPWIAPSLSYLPYIGRHMKALGDFAFKQVTHRMQEGSIQNDLFYHLLDEAPEDRKPPPFPVIMTNAVTAMLAGSDTTAVALCNVFYCILAHPACYTLLQQEVDAAFPPGQGEPVDASKLASMEYLNAVINEALRLYPSIPTSLQRSPTPGSGSHAIGNRLVVSEGTGVFVSPYAVQRDSRYFAPHPDSFMPQRWLARRDDKGSENMPFTVNPDAFIPFSSGPANCVGRPVAILAMRMVLAYLLQHFNMRLADGYDKAQWVEELRDYFAFQKGTLPVFLKPRT
uniref:Cytochrome P450 n=1 Tax=Rhodonia placenta TaxID=104341 RepID=F1SY27_9APHY|nr:cytochrome P450 [Postia placenta]